MTNSRKSGQASQTGSMHSSWRSLGTGWFAVATLLGGTIHGQGHVGRSMVSSMSRDGLSFIIPVPPCVPTPGPPCTDHSFLHEDFTESEQGGGLSVTIGIPRFPDEIGTLKAMTIGIVSSASGVFGMEHIDTCSPPFEFELTIHGSTLVSLPTSAGGPVVQITATASNSGIVSLGNWDGVLDFAGISGHGVSLDRSGFATRRFVEGGPLDLDHYRKPIGLPMSFVSGSVHLGGGGSATQVSGGDCATLRNWDVLTRGFVVVRYEYEP